MLHSVTPFFIVDDLGATLEFYQSRLGFNVLHKMLMFKHIAPEVHPQPNRSRHEWAAWDAYIFASDPGSLYAEFLARDVPMHRNPANTSDGPRAFEIADNNGYVLCVGRPVERT